jgi:hypothetical protein
MDEFSLADLTALTKSKRRSVQLWAEAGVIRAEQSSDRAGTGTHRRFSRAEAMVACLIGGLTRHFQMPIGVLIQVSEGIRQTVLKFESAVKAGRVCFLVVQPANSQDGQRFRVSASSGMDEANAAQALVKAILREGQAFAVLRVNEYLSELMNG